VDSPVTSRRDENRLYLKDPKTGGATKNDHDEPRADWQPESARTHACLALLSQVLPVNSPETSSKVTLTAAESADELPPPKRNCHPYRHQRELSWKLGHGVFGASFKNTTHNSKITIFEHNIKSGPKKSNFRISLREWLRNMTSKMANITSKTVTFLAIHQNWFKKTCLHPIWSLLTSKEYFSHSAVAASKACHDCSQAIYVRQRQEEATPAGQTGISSSPRPENGNVRSVRLQCRIYELVYV